MHDSATEHVVLLRTDPTDAPAALVFTTTGALGQIGMNELGVCVGINNLTATDGTPGVTWTQVVRHALEQDSAAAARDAILDADSPAATTFSSSTPKATATTSRPCRPLGRSRPLTAMQWRTPTTHSHPRPPPCRAASRRAQDSSVRRLDTARQWLDRDGITADDLMALTREPDAVCQTAVEPITSNRPATVMRPRTKEFWAVWGLPSMNEYQKVSFAR